MLTAANRRGDQNALKPKRYRRVTEEAHFADRFDPPTVHHKPSPRLVLARNLQDTRNLAENVLTNLTKTNKGAHPLKSLGTVSKDADERGYTRI
jgi:hypothetical protein